VKATRSKQKLNDPLLGPLWEDLVECDELLDRADTGFARRTYVRASFAFIEAHAYVLRSTARELLLDEWRTKDQIRLSHLTVLEDHTHRVGPTGDLRPEKAKLSTKAHMAFVIRTNRGMRRVRC